jgi:TonB family protein
LLRVAADSGDTDGTPLYLENQVDAVVTRDATSDGPRYPDSLQVAGVEGSVTAEWVVTSAGQPDTLTFRSVDATHPLFEAAVREVLPRMRFRPAMIAGAPVAQLVRQTFHFRIAPPPPVPPPAAKPR